MSPKAKLPDFDKVMQAMAGINLPLGLYGLEAFSNKNYFEAAGGVPPPPSEVPVRRQECGYDDEKCSTCQQMLQCMGSSFPRLFVLEKKEDDAFEFRLNCIDDGKTPLYEYKLYLGWDSGQQGWHVTIPQNQPVQPITYTSNTAPAINPQQGFWTSTTLLLKNNTK